MIHIDKAELVQALEISTQSFLDLIATVPEEKFHWSPGPGAWSVAQVIEHVLITESGVNHVLLAPPQKKEDRDPGEKVAYIQQVFFDFEQRYQAGGPILPRGKRVEREELVSKFKAIREKLTRIIADQNLAITCGSFVHRIFGSLTRLEWVYFNLAHSRRHEEQIKKILA